VPFHNRVDEKKQKASGASSGVRAKAPAPADAPPSAAADASSSSQRGGPSNVAALEAMGGVYEHSKRAVVFQRYCHVYRAGELRELVDAVGGCAVEDEYMDTGNHCVVVVKARSDEEGAGVVPPRELELAPPPAQPAATVDVS